MSAPITITVSGPDSADILTVTQTIWQALNDASLEVEWPNGDPRFAVTSLYEHQTQLAMAGSRCLLRHGHASSLNTAKPEPMVTTKKFVEALRPNRSEG